MRRAREARRGVTDIFYMFFCNTHLGTSGHPLDYDLGTMAYDGQGGNEFHFQGGHKHPAARDCLFRLCSLEESVFFLSLLLLLIIVTISYCNQIQFHLLCIK